MIMDVIKRSKDTGTYFRLIAGSELKKCKVIQIVLPHVYENKSGYAVFLCEVESEEMTDGN